MGTPEFSVLPLEKLIEYGHKIEAVVTQPDKLKGRKKVLSFPAVKECALNYHIPVYQPIKVKEKEFVEKLKQINPEIIIVVAFGQILSKEILDIPKYGCINIHASLLPKLRGAAPIQWAIINGEKNTGVTSMYMNEGLDTGDMLLKKEIEITKEETAKSLHDKLSKIGAEVLIETLKSLENETLVREKQQEDKATYAKILTKELGKIDFSKQAAEIERLIRGLNPWPSAYTFYQKKMLKIWSADVLEQDKMGDNGDIIEVTDDVIIVQTQKGALVIKEVQLEGKKRMETKAFLRGYMVKKGEKLG